MNNPKNKPVRPFQLEYQDAKNEIIHAINSASKTHGIPFFLLETLLSELLFGVKQNAEAERESALRMYELQLAEQADSGKTNAEEKSKEEGIDNG